MSRYVRTRAGFSAQRGGILAGIVAFHVLLGVAFSHAGIRQIVLPPAPPVEVVFVEDRSEIAPPPALPAPRLVDAPAIQVPVPVVNLPAVEPAPATITVVQASQPQAPVGAAPSASSELPLVVDAVDFVKPPQPRYPPKARQARVQGVVHVLVLIDEQGRPRDVKVHRSSGSEQLDHAACESVREALFRPYRENGVARSAQVIFPVTFSLSVRTARS